MNLVLQFPERLQEKIVETEQMQRAANRTLAVHRGSALSVWSGPSRVGKTTTAHQLTGQINRQYDASNPNTFRAVHYEAGEIPTGSGNTQKRGIRSLYTAVVGRLDEGTYRHLPPEELARQLVHGCQRKAVQMVLIDEAGMLSLDAIRGMVLVRDTAELMGKTLSLVFIGMDDLPQKMCAIPQVEKRIHEWVYFEPYTLDETWALLAELHPYFQTLDARKQAHRDQVAFVHEQFGGMAGEIVPFLRRLTHRLQGYTDEVDMRLLRAVHMMTQRDKDRAITDAKMKYRGKPANTTNTKIEKAVKA